MNSLKHERAVMPYFAHSAFIQAVKSASNYAAADASLLAFDLGARSIGVAWLSLAVKIAMPQEKLETVSILPRFAVKSATGRRLSRRPGKPPVPMLQHSSQSMCVLVQPLVELFGRRRVCGIVVGCARQLGEDGIFMPDPGNPDFFAIHAAFANSVHSIDPGLPLTLYDERFTTGMAHSILRSHGVRRRERHDRDDSMAASIILDGFFSLYGRQIMGAMEG